MAELDSDLAQQQRYAEVIAVELFTDTGKLSFSFWRQSQAIGMMEHESLASGEKIQELDSATRKMSDILGLQC